MTAIQQQAIQLIQRLPDTKIQAIITLATDELHVLELEHQTTQQKKEMAFAQLENLDLNLPADFDPAKELIGALGEKYDITT